MIECQRSHIFARPSTPSQERIVNAILMGVTDAWMSMYSRSWLDWLRHVGLTKTVRRNRRK